MPAKIFISYRRDDVAGDARGIRDGLAAKFGRADVFMDVDDLVAGQRVDEALVTSIDLFDPETGRTYGGVGTKGEQVTPPGRLVPKMNDYVWPPIQMRPGETTVLKLSKNIRVSKPRSQFCNVRPAGGGPERSFPAVKGTNVPPGVYQVWRSDAALCKGQRTRSR
jgi:hypothetical protein